MAFKVHSHAGPITEFPTLEESVLWLIDFFEEYNSETRVGRRLAPQFNPDIYFVEGPDGTHWRIERDGRYYPVPSSEEEARRAPNVRSIAERDTSRSAPVCLDASGYPDGANQGNQGLD